MFVVLSADDKVHGSPGQGLEERQCPVQHTSPRAGGRPPLGGTFGRVMTTMLMMTMTIVVTIAAAAYAAYDDDDDDDDCGHACCCCLCCL